MRSIAIAIMVAMAALGPLPGRADTPTVDSYVYSYNGPASAYEIERSKQRITLKPLLVLLPNDRVKVLTATNKLRNDPNYIILKIGSEYHTLDASNAPYCVGARNGDCTVPVVAPNQNFCALRVVLCNIIASAGALLGRAHQDQYTDATESTTPRGVPPTLLRVSIPMLDRTQQRLASGKRALAISWQGGIGPYEVRLYRDDVATPLEKMTVSGSTEARLPAVSFVEGTYRIEIDDNGNGVNQTAYSRFSVVAPATLPTPTPAQAQALADPAVPADLRATLEATLLVQNGKAWTLEAYQRIASIAEAYRPAGLLRYLLTNGL